MDWRRFLGWALYGLVVLVGFVITMAVVTLVTRWLQ